MKARMREGLWSLTEGVVLGVSFLAVGGCSPYRLNRFIARRLQGAIRQEFAWRRIPQALKRAERRGLIHVRVLRNGTVRARVTDEGRRVLARRQATGAAADRPKRWDGLWRVLVFDVPESRRHDRNVLRKTLQNLGFASLQASVWVYPFDCRALIAAMRTAYNLSHITVRYLVVRDIEDDHALRMRFNV